MFAVSSVHQLHARSSQYLHRGNRLEEEPISLVEHWGRSCQDSINCRYTAICPRPSNVALRSTRPWNAGTMICTILFHSLTGGHIGSGIQLRSCKFADQLLHPGFRRPNTIKASRPSQLGHGCTAILPDHLLYACILIPDSCSATGFGGFSVHCLRLGQTIHKTLNMTSTAATKTQAGDKSPTHTTQRTRPRQKPGAACEECRRRKLRCDRRQPQCGSCQSTGVPCHTTTVRAARGPKPGYLKDLKARIGKSAVGRGP